jgi:hypothetical protein
MMHGALPSTWKTIFTGIKQLAQAIFLIAEQIEYERCESILRIARIMMDSASTLSRG